MNDGAAALDYWKRSVRIYALLGLTRDTNIMMEKLKVQAAKSGAKFDIIETLCSGTKRQGRNALCE